jgi:hypothetical protein
MYSPENYNHNRHWSDRFLPQVMKVLSFGKADVRITPFWQDVKEAADLKILADSQDEEDIYAAVRLRKSSYASRYPFEFTVRYKYTAGYKTEYEKIMEGYADIMFYGFVIGKNVARWIMLDMDVFRAEAEEDYISKEHKYNADGRNSFLAFDVRSFKNNIILSHSVGYFDE